jgi:hypothetical protein
MRSAVLTLRTSDTNVAAWTSRTRLLTARNVGSGGAIISNAIVFATTAMFNCRSVFGTVADQAHDAVLAQIGNR